MSDTHYHRGEIRMNKKNIAKFGPILKQSAGSLYGFRINFNTNKEAQHYKDMFIWIVKDDRYKIMNECGYGEKRKE